MASLPRRFLTPVHFEFLGGSELSRGIDSTETAARSDILAGSASSEPTSLEILMFGLNLLTVASTIARFRKPIKAARHHERLGRKCS